MSNPEPAAPAPTEQSSDFQLNLGQLSQPTAEAPADAAYTARGTATSGYTSWFSRRGSSTAAAEPPPALPGKGSSTGVVDEPYTPGGHAVGAYEPLSLRRSMRTQSTELNELEAERQAAELALRKQFERRRSSLKEAPQSAAPTTASKRTRPRRAGALAAVLLAVLVGVWSCSGGRGPEEARVRLLLGPVDLGHGGRVELQAHASMLPRLTVIVGRTFDEQALVALLDFMSTTLRRRRPFTVLWDVRDLRWPRVGRTQLGIVRAWVDANAARWDSFLQAHALRINPLARPLAWLVLRLFAPPQPVHIAGGDSDALEFARTCGSCVEPRSWVKDSYADRESRFGTFGKSWFR